MALIAGLLMVASLTAIGVFSMNVTTVNEEIARHLKASKQAFYLADAGIQHAKIFLNQNTSQWNNYATAQTLLNPTQLSTIGTYTVTIQDAGGGARRTISTGNASSNAKAVIEALFSRTSLFRCALCAKGDITFSGGAVVDSFDSSVGPYTAATAGSQGDAQANGNISLSGTPTTVQGSASAGGTVSTNAGAIVTGTTANGAVPLPFPPEPPCGPPWSLGLGIIGGIYDPLTGQLRATGGTNITLADGTYCLSSINLSGSSALTVNGPVTIHLTDRSDLTGGGVMNTTRIAQNLQIFSSYTSSSQGITIAGGSLAYMSIYAPNAQVKFSGGSDFYGQAVGGSVVNTGGTNVHYDTSFNDGRGSVELVSWREVF